MGGRNKPSVDIHSWFHSGKRRHSSHYTNSKNSSNVRNQESTTRSCLLSRRYYDRKACLQKAEKGKCYLPYRPGPPRCHTFLAEWRLTMSSSTSPKSPSFR